MDSIANPGFAILKNKAGGAVPLAGIDVKARIGDVFSRTVVTQLYENREEINIEAVYTFPLPSEAILLEFTVTIDGRVRRGEVMKKRQAQRAYENAVEQGNTAAMLEEIGDGLYSMNIGNILAGQKIEISFSYSEFNIWNGHLLRFCMPSVIAPRYGDPASAGISEHQTPVTSPDAVNRLSWSVLVTGELAGCAVTCPTHQVRTLRQEDGILLKSDSFADRDLVVEIRAHRDPVPYAALGRDGDGYVAAVAITPDFGEELESSRRDVDIIIDCSGSMSGQSIQQARSALIHILSQLKPLDCFNIIRFGSRIVPLFDRPVPAEEEYLQQARALLERLEADLGGTEIAAALDSAYASHNSELHHDILLITDGQVYVSDDFYERAIRSGSRIFAVGVGNAVSEGILRRLSNVTGGKAEFVTPNESMAEKIVRHFQRMCCPAAASEIRWPAEADWIWPENGPRLFHGDTSVFFASFGRKPEGAAELKTLASEKSLSWTSELPASADETECSDLARMAVRRRIAGSDTDESAVLAVKYRLVSPLTSYILVEENADSQNIPLPELRTVPQMPPAGMMGVAMCCQSLAVPPSPPGMGMMNMMGMMGMNSPMFSAMKKAGSSPDSGNRSASGANSSGGDLQVHFYQLLDTLSSLDEAQVRELFRERSIDALARMGLPKLGEARLRLIASRGADESVLFILFLNRLLETKSGELGGAPVAAYISRAFSRLAPDEQKLKDPEAGLFDELFASC